jgi:hypothetical protein
VRVPEGASTFRQNSRPRGDKYIPGRNACRVASAISAPAKMARALRAPVPSPERAAFAKARLWIEFGGKKCGRQTEEKNCERGNGQREEKHHVIRSNQIQPRGVRVPRARHSNPHKEFNLGRNLHSSFFRFSRSHRSHYTRNNKISSDSLRNLNPELHIFGQLGVAGPHGSSSNRTFD